MENVTVAVHPPSSILQPRKLLVRGVNWLGDAVMTTPALYRLRERFPEAHITLLTHEKLAGLWLHQPSLNAIVTFSTGEPPWSVARRLRSENFDLALVLPNSPRSVLEAWLARIPHRLGYARSWRKWFLTQPVAPRPDHVTMHKLSDREVNHLIRLPAPTPAASHGGESRIAYHALSHQINEYLHLVAALGGNASPVAPALSVTPEEIRAATLKFGLENEPVSSHPILGLNPGAEYGPAKRWPAKRFIAAAKEIQQRTGCIWLIFGGKADAPLACAIESALQDPGSTDASSASAQFEETRGRGVRAPIAAESPVRPAVLNLAGKTSLRELMALLKLCRVLLTNDTGPMHVAAALGTPVVVPFGSTSPELTGPGLPGDLRHHLLKSDAPCSPCFRRACPIDFRCMTKITVESVVEAVEMVINNSGH
jgi:heptosyltransferase-2